MEKRPPLTHFLCLPLVNSVSLPQLESSIASFKATMSSCFQPDENGSPTLQPLIPDGAIRPVGTLHLTLGVMSLPTKERLDEALRFFQSLDFASILSEAGNIAKKRGHGTTGALPSNDGPNMSNRPFTISLESLHALPKARSATVLHAAPVDPTSRLYPFCELLRDRFLEAGFLQGEVKHDKSRDGGQKPEDKVSTGSETVGRTEAPVDESSLEEMQADVAGQPVRASATTNSGKPKARRLLLHATVVNTIYIKGRRQKSGHQKGKNRRAQYSFDARDILAHYKDYYVDSDRTTPRNSLGNITGQAEKEIPSGGKESTSEDTGSSSKGSVEKRPGTISDQQADDRSHNPFIWAKDFPLDSVCICEMGAKKLDPAGDRDGMNARLGEKYTVVAKRRLVFEPSKAPRPGSSEGSMDGGVAV
ncbi:AKAP7 2'5' RNA ligase-like domain-containing protein [Aspergillus ambiguus]|uniref:uncharacterized protein n=1 Tax=Aspergillus ambiguus TaxID=176160 RepID=UPI003CCD0FD3